MRDTEISADAGLSFSVGDLSAWDEAQDLIRANHAETGGLPAADFAPSRAAYENLERAGVLRVFQVRVPDERANHLLGRLVGYAMFVVGPHPDYPSIVYAAQRVLYVHPDYRGRRALDFIEWQDALFRRQGIHVVGRQVNRRCDYSRALESMAYRAEEVTFIRDLREKGDA